MQLDDRLTALGIVSIFLGIGLLLVLRVFRSMLRAGQSKTEIINEFLQPVGFVARLTVYAVLFGLLYLYSPEKDILKKPLAGLTLEDIFGRVLWIAIVLFLIRALFDPVQETGIKDAWNKLGLFMMFCALVFLVLVRPDFIASFVRGMR